jgi:hypothetical protein
MELGNNLDSKWSEFLPWDWILKGLLLLLDIWVAKGNFVG